MKDFLKMLGFFIQLLIVSLVLTACFTGLYTLVHIGDPRYAENRERLWQDADSWGMQMTAISFLVVLILAVCGVAFNDAVILFIDNNPDLIAFGFLSIVGALFIGLLSGVVALLND
jgi:hypothetical protein